MLLDTWVPDDSAKPDAEICHAFVYRWLIGRKKILPVEGVDPMTGPFNGTVMKPILWPEGEGVLPVRQAGINQVRPGDIIGFFDKNLALVHSMVAEAEEDWVGANNTGCFGTRTGRTKISNVYLKMRTNDYPIGWVDTNGNKFIAMGGECTVVYRTP
jgi:hypothetical protein